MTVLYFDCFSGVAGDMLLGALIDAGVPLEDVRGALGSLAIDPDTVWTERVTRAGITATKFCVRGEDAGATCTAPTSHAHDHARHSHGAHATRTTKPRAPDARRDRVPDRRVGAEPARARTGRSALFHRLGEAEAAIHGTPVDQVHLHEVGALDSIIDIVGTVYALEQLGADRRSSRRRSTSAAARSRPRTASIPVPAPATLRLLRDVAGLRRASSRRSW